MDISRAPHNAQTRLKTVLTPIWTKDMGHRLRIAREAMLRTQAELAKSLSTPGHPVGQQAVAALEDGRRSRIQVTWARVEASLGRHTGYVLIAKEKALYDEHAIALRYHDYRQRAMRKRGDVDPKRGDGPPWPHRWSLETRIREGRAMPKKRRKL